MINKQPVAYVAAAIVILQIVQSFLQNEPISMTAIDSLMVTLGALFIQKKTKPKAKINELDLQKMKRGLAEGDK